MREETTLPKRWLSADDLLKEYGIGLSNQQKLRTNRKIPFSKVGRYIRYDRVKIDQWLENNSIDVL